MDMARIGALHALPRLLEFAAAQTARLFNVSDLADPFRISRPIIRDYITLPERVFLLELLPPWHLRQPGRLVKTPKMHLTDTGMASALLRLDAAALHKDRALLGQLLETFVFQELRRQASWEADPIAFSHFRDRDDHEVPWPGSKSKPRERFANLIFAASASYGRSPGIASPAAWCCMTVKRQPAWQMICLRCRSGHCGRRRS